MLAIAAIVGKRWTGMLMSEIELKPCPFCGGEVELSSISDYEGYYFDLAVTCNGCGVDVVFDTEINCPKVEDFPEETVRKAIEKWNRRATNDQYIRKEDT